MVLAFLCLLLGPAPPAAHAIVPRKPSRLTLSSQSRLFRPPPRAAAETALPAAAAAPTSGGEDEGVPHVVVVGGGWAGFGAAEALSGLVEKGALRVTLLEASPRGPGGLAAGWRTDKGREVEVGLHGFWRSYRNIDDLVANKLGLTGEASPFTPYAQSSLFTKQEKKTPSSSSSPPSAPTVVAPVLGDLPRLPAPLGTALWPTFSSDLSLADRASAGLLVGPWLDFDGGDKAWARYDGMSASTLFSLVSRALYSAFLEPMLLVLPMAPGPEISAAAALSCFSFFALEHQGDFDVRWLKASATAAIFEPWRDRLASRGVVVRDGARADEFLLSPDGGHVTGVVASLRTLDAEKDAPPEREAIPCDALINAVSISGVQSMMRNPANKPLSRRPEFQRLLRLRSVAVVAVRVWLDKDIGEGAPEHTPSNVCGGGLVEGLEEIGFTFYWVNELQKQEGGSTNGTVLEIDFYNASPLLGLSDADALDLAVRALEAASPECFQGKVADSIEDFAVVRAPNAVSHFAPGSFANLPKTRAESLANWFHAGDWVDRGGHRSWSQEKALVTGYQAGRAAAEELERALSSSPSRASAGREMRRLIDTDGCIPQPLDVEPDEPHVAAGRGLLREARARLERLAGM